MPEPHAATSLLRDGFILLGSALAFVLLFRRLGLGATLGYLVAGAVMGPHVLGLVGDAESKIGIAEIYLAQIQSDQNMPQAALETLADAKHNYDVSYGTVHPNHGDLLIYRAKVLAKVGRFAEARADCAEGMDILRATLGAEASFTKTNAAKCAAIAETPARPGA